MNVPTTLEGTPSQLLHKIIFGARDICKSHLFLQESIFYFTYKKWNVDIIEFIDIMKLIVILKILLRYYLNK